LSMMTVSGGSSWAGRLSTPIVVFLVLEVVVIVLIIATRPKRRVWLRGGLGSGRSVKKFVVGVNRSGRKLTR